jgi:hypothetical protein
MRTPHADRSLRFISVLDGVIDRVVRSQTVIVILDDTEVAAIPDTIPRPQKNASTRGINSQADPPAQFLGHSVRPFLRDSIRSR